MARNIEAKKQYLKQYRIKNRQKIYQYQKAWKLANKERIANWYREYGLKNKDKIKAYLKEWYKNNKTRILQEDKGYYLKNKEHIDKRNTQWQKEHRELCRKYTKKWRKEHPNERRIYENNRRNTNICEKLSDNIRRRISSDLICRHGNKKRKHWEKLVGFTVEELKQHLELLFKSDMNWSNYGNFWEIDHIKPLASFKFSSYKDEEFKKCWALNNLQPLTCSENRSKGKKILNIN